MAKGIISIAHVFLAGECPELWPDDLPKQGAFVLAADGGYRHLQRLGLKPDLLLGDFDSLSLNDLRQAERDGIIAQSWPAEKDFTDAELALSEVYARGITSCRLFGALGGTRIDHALANIWLMAFWKKRGLRIELVHGPLRATMLETERMEMKGQKGDLVSLLPFSPRVEDVRFSGVKYPLSAETLHAGEGRGVSNELTGDSAVLEIGAGLLLVLHYRSLQP